MQTCILQMELAVTAILAPFLTPPSTRLTSLVGITGEGMHVV